MKKETDTAELRNEDIIHKLRSGNHVEAGKAMKTIIAGATGRIRDFVVGSRGSEADVQDLIQDVALLFWKRFSDETTQPLRTSYVAFFESIAWHAWADRLSRINKNQTFPIELLTESEKDSLGETYDLSIDTDDNHSLKGEFRLSETIIVAQLTEAIESLTDERKKKEFIEKALSNDSHGQDVKTLIDQIVALSFRAGHQISLTESTDLARSKLISNSDNQAHQLIPIIREIKKNGANTLQEIADAMNSASITTKNGHQWYASTVKQVIERIISLGSASDISLPADDFTQQMRPIIKEMREAGTDSPTSIARALNEKNITTKSGQKWYPNTVQILLKRLDEAQQGRKSVTPDR